MSAALRLGIRAGAFGLAAALASGGVARAHPHVLVTVRSAIEIQQGAIVAIAEDWTFDAMYTAFVATGFGAQSMTPSPQELDSLAKQNIEGLKDYGYFTFLKSEGGLAKLDPPRVYSAQLTKTNEGDDELGLHFETPLAPPVAAGGRHDLMIYDPSYYAAMSIDAVDGIRIVGDGGRCSTTRIDPAPLSDSERQSLTESFFSNLPPGADFGQKMAQTIEIDCPAALNGASQSDQTLKRGR